MRFIILIGILLFSGCQQSMVKKTKNFMDFDNVQGQKFLNNEYSFEECTQNYKKKYAELFGNITSDYSKYNDGLLKDMWKIDYIMSFQSIEQKYLHQMEIIFEDLEKRHLGKEKCAESTCAEELFGLYIKFGEFAKARQLKEEYPEVLQESVPAVYEDSSMLRKHHKLYKVSPDGKHIDLISVQMEKGPQIVAVLDADCQFAKRAIETIRDADEVREYFEKYALIISPLNTSISQVFKIAEWNKDNPKLEYYIYSGRKDLREDWKAFDFTKGTNFYFINNNRVVYQLSGWGPTEEEFGLNMRRGIEKIKEQN